MRCAILGFVAGAAWLQTMGELPDRALMAVCAAVALALLLALRGAVRAAAAGALLGFCWAALIAHLALAPQLAKEDEGRDVTLVGTIDSLPYRFEQGVRFNFAVERVVGEPMAVPPRVSLAWYAGFRDQVQQVGAVQPGERWQLTVRLQRPHGNANPYGFDYEVWQLEQGVRATGYVRPAGEANRRLDSFVFSIGNLVEHCRATLRDRILAALPGKQYAGVIVALVVGDQRAIDQSDWTVFNRTGISHLISISGLHITMIAGVFALLAGWLWRRSFFTGAQLPLMLPAQKVAALAGAGAALLYVLLAGFGVPAQRTLYMLAVVAAALWSGRIASVSHVLCAALGLVVLLDPWAVLWPGFWLSFGAVAVILYATVGRVGARQAGFKAALRLGAHTQYVVTLGLVPLTMLLFAQVSLASPIANAVAIPLVSFVVTPLALAGSMAPAPLSGALLALAHFAVEGLAGFLEWMSASPLAVWSAPTPAPWVFCFAFAGTLWMLAPRGWPHRWTGAAAWLPLLASLPSHPAQGEMAVTAFDVGQGMALLIETSGHRLLYDAGPLYSPDANGGNRVIGPYLKARGIDRLDGMVITHSDADHAGGALAVMAAVKVGWVASSLPPAHPIVRAAGTHSRCAAGQQWSWDGVQFEMLQPTLASYDNAALKPNARGCTLRISAGKHAVLLAADIEAAQEAQLVLASAGQLRADVLLAPHHGSGTSSTPGFLRAVQPALGIFQVGYRNRYHHPKAEVYERYREMGIARMRTDESGAIQLQFGNVVVASEYRRDHARYWYEH
ncbi:DNA internalization-related competence protein ComEC/Rec2 [Massilia sp. R2A-15]|uniref:DNA internalization-related competence protein ComEC/Rec2 n=1 Tax=Massilia sp. R2A-15 TaxID=3064278 RepID=UPI002735BE30|nr:DNA internalization-related competence protein ComEC/Rec2 [Massilia sp. R2A-15]WLI91033.1 DNA internalization-related competence protein ComEC/Rec2 [Massilia sp. R2A-15]